MAAHYTDQAASHAPSVAGGRYYADAERIVRAITYAIAAFSVPYAAFAVCVLLTN
jgi:hypothetical protein